MTAGGIEACFIYYPPGKINSMADPATGKTVDPGRLGFCVKAMGSCGAPAGRMSAWPVRVAAYAAAGSGKTAHGTDAAFQIRAVAFITGGRSREERSRVSSPSGNRPPRRMFTGGWIDV
jgi:hypothetical protein